MIPYHLLNLINNREEHVLSLLRDVPFKSQRETQKASHSSSIEYE